MAEGCWRLNDQIRKRHDRDEAAIDKYGKYDIKLPKVKFPLIMHLYKA